jgi:RNA polymerase sigma-70 factor (ECF subfamily)
VFNPLYVAARPILLLMDKESFCAVPPGGSTEDRENLDGFPVTHWSAILAAGRPEDVAGAEALNRLLELYQHPLLAHLHWKFDCTDEQAEDWLQSFVERKVLGRTLLRNARKDRGRFRTFLLNALDNFVIDELRVKARQRRRPEGGFVSVERLTDAEQGTTGPASDPFDVAWARRVLSQAVDRMKGHYESRGRVDLWGVFAEGCLTPILDDVAAPSMADLASRFGFQSAAQASNALVTTKRMFRQTIESVVAEYASNGEETDEEIRYLTAILSGS